MLYVLVSRCLNGPRSRALLLASPSMTGKMTLVICSFTKATHLDKRSSERSCDRQARAIRIRSPHLFREPLTV